VLVVRPASFITGSSRATEESPSAKAGHSHPPLPISTQARRKTLGIRLATVSGAAAVRHLASTEVREGERLVAYQFVTRCANCAEQFGILWVMDSTRRADPKTVARITCPLCGTRIYQDAKDLLPIESQMEKLVVGRPVRSVEVTYDCPCCNNRGILESLLHTDLSWDELSKEQVEIGVCDNGPCPKKGLLQKLKPSGVVLGSLNPVETSVSPR
jgi:DNA-directed RNA polymerase subunit RPC12/RpoP